MALPPHSDWFYLIKFYSVEIAATIIFLSWICRAVWHELGFPDVRILLRVRGKTPASPTLLDALEAIAWNCSACTCHTRNRYRERQRPHDTHCPIRVARRAISRARAGAT